MADTELFELIGFLGDGSRQDVRNTYVMVLDLYAQQSLALRSPRWWRAWVAAIFSGVMGRKHASKMYGCHASGLDAARAIQG